MIILLHSSKTMRTMPSVTRPLSSPVLHDTATALIHYLNTLSPQQLMTSMKISKVLADKVSSTHAAWKENQQNNIAAADGFLGDIYSGLQAPQWNDTDWEYAQNHLRILSGLYGILKPQDVIAPYRLEMGYKLPDEPYDNLYKFWGSNVADTIDASESICNLAANEYSQLVLPYISPEHVTTPSFLSINPTTQKPSFVVVHAKIARGAFANWLIKNRVINSKEFTQFRELGYTYDTTLSKPGAPVFICNSFGGKGLSLRLT